MDNFLAKLGTRQINHNVNTECSITNIKSKLWQVLLRDLPANADILFDYVTHKYYFNYPLLLSEFWCNKSYDSDKYVSLLNSHPQNKLKFTGMSMDVILFMRNFMKQVDWSHVLETAVTLSVEKPIYGYSAYHASLHLEDNSLTNLATILGVRMVCERLIFNPYILTFDDCQNLYAITANDEPIYLLNDTHPLFINDVLLSVVLCCDLHCVFALSKTCRDWYRFIMRDTILRRVRGVQFQCFERSNLVNYHREWSDTYVQQMATHFVLECFDHDYVTSELPLIPSNNVVVYEGTHYHLDNQGANIVAMKFTADESQADFFYQKDLKYWSWISHGKTLPIYVVNEDIDKNYPPLHKCKIMSWNYSKVNSDIFWDTIQADVCDHYYFYKVNFNRTFLFDSIGINKLTCKMTPNKSLYILDNCDFMNMYDLVSCGQMFQHLFVKLVIWTRVIELTSNINVILNFLKNICKKKKTPLKSIIYIFTAKWDYKKNFGNDKKNNPAQLVWDWLYKNWESLANNYKIVEFKMCLIVSMISGDKSAVLVDFKKIMNNDDLVKAHKKWMNCLMCTHTYDSSEAFQLWRSLWTPFFQIANAELRRLTQ